MERVLVTGAYGFLGRYVVREMLDHGYSVVAFGRDAGKLESLRGDRVELVQGDFTIHGDIEKATRDVDYVIHCGALLKGWGRREDFMQVNVEGTRNVLRACEKHQVKRLVYTSAPSAYATRDNLGITELDFNGDNRLNGYIESKILAEQLVRGQDAVPWAVIRPRGICGIGDENMIPALIRANETIGIPLFQGGEVIVDLCCVENVALALRLCMERDAALGQVYNITNGEPRRLRDLTDAMFPKLGLQPRYLKLPFVGIYGASAVLESVFKLLHIYDTAPPVTRSNICMLGKSQVFDITKARQELGYCPRVSLDEMIDAYARDYLARNGESG